jgi:hypothetical protein
VDGTLRALSCHSPVLVTALARVADRATIHDPAAALGVVGGQGEDE